MSIMRYLILTLILSLPVPALADIVTRLKELEGFSATAYKPVDTEEHYTIGYGHYGPDVSVDDTITEEEATVLLLKDIEIRQVEIRKAITVYDSLSEQLQIELMQSWFRGGLVGSPITISFINDCRFDEAAAEFLRNKEYQTTTLLGVKTRMEAVAQALLEETSTCLAYP